MLNEEELTLPYYGNINEALIRGDKKAAKEIMRWRAKNISVIINEDEEIVCKISIGFLDSRGIKKDTICIDNFPKQTTKIYGFDVVSLGDKYVIINDISSSKDIIAVPIGNRLYELIRREDYEVKFQESLYGIYTHIYRKIKNNRPTHDYESFIKFSIARQLKEIENITNRRQENVSKKLERSYQNRL